MTTPDRITLRLGPLAGPLAASAQAEGRSLSEEIRQRLAWTLEVEPPALKVGNPDFRRRAVDGQN